MCNMPASAFHGDLIHPSFFYLQTYINSQYICKFIPGSYLSSTHFIFLLDRMKSREGTGNQWNGLAARVPANRTGNRTLFPARTVVLFAIKTPPANTLIGVCASGAERRGHSAAASQDRPLAGEAPHPGTAAPRGGPRGD